MAWLRNLEQKIYPEHDIKMIKFSNLKWGWGNEMKDCDALLKLFSRGVFVNGPNLVLSPKY